MKLQFGQNLIFGNKGVPTAASRGKYIKIYLNTQTSSTRNSSTNKKKKLIWVLSRYKNWVLSKDKNWVLSKDENWSATEA